MNYVVVVVIQVKIDVINIKKQTKLGIVGSREYFIMVKIHYKIKNKGLKSL